MQSHLVKFSEELEGRKGLCFSSSFLTLEGQPCCVPSIGAVTVLGAQGFRVQGELGSLCPSCRCCHPCPARGGHPAAPRPRAGFRTLCLSPARLSRDHMMDTCRLGPSSCAAWCFYRVSEWQAPSLWCLSFSVVEVKDSFINREWQEVRISHSRVCVCKVNFTAVLSGRGSFLPVEKSANE